MSIRPEFTEAHHPNENLAERCGGAIKAATVPLLRITGCPLEFWCYAREHVCSLRTILARRSLDWSTLHELHWGEQPDISMSRFIFWEPIWYLNPRQAFPKTKMLKGRFLGIAQNVGDAFCFLILMQPECDSDSSPLVLARSVIRRQYTSNATPVVERSRSSPTSFAIYKSDSVTPLDDWVPSSDADDQVGDLISPIVDELDLPTTSSAQNGHLSDVPKGMTKEEAFESDIVVIYSPLAKGPSLEHIPPLSNDTANTLEIPPQIHDAQDSVVCCTDGEPVVPQLATPLSHRRLCPDLVIANETGPLPSLTTPSPVDLPNDGSANGP
jgi:hypothetical protein